MSSVLDRMRAIAALRGVSSTHKAVLWALQLRADNETGECWPSMVTLSEDAGVSRSCVKLAVPQLVALGHISKRRRQREGVLEADSNVYTVHVKGPGAAPVAPGEVGHHVTQVGHEVTHVGHVVAHRGSPRVLGVGHVVAGGGSPGVLELLTELPIGTANGTRERAEHVGHVVTHIQRVAPKAEPSGRGTRIQATWKPAPRTIAWAAGRGVDADACVEEFVEYWQTIPGTRGRKANWDLTFRGRIRQLLEQGRAPALPPTEWQPSPDPPITPNADGAARASAIIDGLVATKSAKNLGKGVSHGRT